MTYAALGDHPQYVSRLRWVRTRFLRTLLDTGADVNLIREDVAERLGSMIVDCPNGPCVIMANGHRDTLTKGTYVTMTFDAHGTPWEKEGFAWAVRDSPHECIIGFPQMSE